MIWLVSIRLFKNTDDTKVLQILSDGSLQELVCFQNLLSIQKNSIVLYGKINRKLYKYT